MCQPYTPLWNQNAIYEIRESTSKWSALFLSLVLLELDRLILFGIRIEGSSVTTGPLTPLAKGQHPWGAAFWWFAQRIDKLMSDLMFNTVDGQKMI